MSVLTRKPDPTRLSWGDVEVIATTQTGWRFVSYDGLEYLIGPTPLDPSHVAAPIGPDEIRITEPREQTTFGTVERSTATFRGEPVAIGASDEALATEARQRRVLAVKQPRAVDLIASSPMFRSRGDIIIGGGTIGAALAPGEHTRPDVAAVLRRCARDDVTLIPVAGGRLVVQAPGGRAMSDLLGAIAATRRLLYAALTGASTPCELWHSGTAPAAVTIVADDVAACGDHADGSLPIMPTGKGAA